MVENGTEVMLEGVRLIFRNFAGKPGKFNSEGERNFGVVIDDETAQVMADDGWNVKMLQPRDEDEDDTPTPWLPVKVKYSEKSKPPRIVIVTENNRTNLDEDQVEMVDWADVENVDLMIRAYVWNVNDNTGVSAYLKSAYITIQEDELEKKYAAMDN